MLVFAVCLFPLLHLTPTTSTTLDAAWPHRQPLRQPHPLEPHRNSLFSRPQQQQPDLPGSQAAAQPDQPRQRRRQRRGAGSSRWQCSAEYAGLHRGRAGGSSWCAVICAAAGLCFCSGRGQSGVQGGQRRGGRQRRGCSGCSRSRRCAWWRRQQRQGASGQGAGHHHLCGGSGGPQ